MLYQWRYREHLDGLQGISRQSQRIIWHYRARNVGFDLVIVRVVPVTAHAAFDKAAQFFKIKIRHARVDPVTFAVDVRAVRRACNGNTIMVIMELYNAFRLQDRLQGSPTVL